MKCWKKVDKYDYMNKKTNQMVGVSKDKKKWYFVAEIEDYHGHKRLMPKEFKEKKEAIDEMKRFMKMSKC